MRIAIAQLNYHIGNFEHNEAKILEAIEEACKTRADLVCFSELATTGYPPLDLLEFRDFIDKSNELLEKVKKASKEIGIVIGAPRLNPELPGKALFNSAFFYYGEKLLGFVDKGLLPTYDVFDEYRYFEPAKNFSVIPFKGHKIALTICEDIWDLINEDPNYTFHPMDKLDEGKPTFAINISASPFHRNQHINRKKVLRANATKYNMPFFYCNHVGGQTDLIFDGGSMVVNPSGKIHEEMPWFEECVRTFELENVISSDDIVEQNNPDAIELIHRALVFGLRDYFAKLGFKKAILGLSGGIDSAVTAALACEALGAENVLSLLMPSPFSSNHSIEDAETLAKNLGMSYEILGINDLYDKFNEVLQPHFNGKAFDVTEENLQARIRGTLLMAFCNKFGPVLLNTTNKSEMAVGYGTLYGDLCGGLSVIGDVYKTEVYQLAHQINRNREIIPKNSILKPPSAELKANQKDTDSLPDYNQLDLILFQYIEQQKSPSKIVQMGFDREVVSRICHLVNTSEFKRYQTAPVLRVSTKAFGLGRRMPIVAKYTV